jgi:hypothetical protein|uniref:Uncharacterized protein n=1 Tax=viral metagenome TaxID=1070528 RepID=A0A6C0LGS9_9ZZZZ
MFEIFSYWIFVWFLLYYFKLTKYNPLIILIIGYIITFGEWLYLIFMGANNYNIIKFIIINVIIKIIPILLIYNSKTTYKDLIIGLYIFLAYLLTMAIMKIDPYKIYKKILNTYIYDDNKYKSIISKMYDYIYIIIIDNNGHKHI